MATCRKHGYYDVLHGTELACPFCLSDERQGVGRKFSDDVKPEVAAQAKYEKLMAGDLSPLCDGRNGFGLPPGAPGPAKSGTVRTFVTGATRDGAANKPDFEGFISPLVLEAFATYMHYNRLLPDGSMRDSDNWQKGIPLDAYMKSGWRHFFDWWRIHRGLSAHENLVWAICGLLFNLQGYLHEQIKADPHLLEICLEQMEQRRKLKSPG